MYSLNVPVPVEIARLASGLAAETIEATPRERHTLGVKRLGDGDPERLTRRIREAAAGTGPFGAAITGVDVFRRPTAGPGPVAYLTVDSPVLVRLHERLCAVFDPVDGIEGDDYVPHVTVARGGDADRLLGREIDAAWTVDSLVVWSARYEEPVERLALPLL